VTGLPSDAAAEEDTNAGGRLVGEKQYVTRAIRLDDGSTGTQTVLLDGSIGGKLIEVCIERLADGTLTRQVYHTRGWYSDNVWSLADLAGRTWVLI